MLVDDDIYEARGVVRLLLDAAKRRGRLPKEVSSHAGLEALRRRRCYARYLCLATPSLSRRAMADAPRAGAE